MANDESFHKAKDHAVAIWVGMAVSIVAFPLLFILPCVQTTTKHPLHPSKRNLRAIGLALHGYHETYRAFPPAFIADGNGQPMHSWRVLILPFLDEQELYDRYRFDQPWHGPDNWQLIDQVPDCFRFRHADQDGRKEVKQPSGTTIYVAPRGEGTVMSGAIPVSIDDVTDGSSDTVQVVEDSFYPVPWLAPDDVPFELCLKHLQMSAPAGIPYGQHLLLCDGTVRFLLNDLDKDVFRKLLIRNDGEEIGPY